MDLGIEGLVWRRTIGHGGFGVVHAATDEAHGREVAVKVLSVATDENTRRRFDRERRSMGSLSSHPNIVTVFASGYTASSQPYIVMELVENGALNDRLRSGPLSWDEVRQMAIELSDALQATHEAGIIHCDIKPANILLGRNNRPMLTDFGIAAMAGDESLRMTVSATPAYAAPELIQGREVDERSDLYSLAATLYTCLDGRPPYGDTTNGLLGVLSSIVTDPVPVLTTVPDQAAGLLARAMTKEPSGRISLSEFRTELEQLDSGNPFAKNLVSSDQTQLSPPSINSGATGNDHPSMSHPTTHPSSTRGTLVVALSLILLVGGFATWLLLRDTNESLSAATPTSQINSATSAVTAAATSSTMSAPPIQIPDVSGLGIANAISLLKASGLDVSVGDTCDSGIARGTNPQAGTLVEVGQDLSPISTVFLKYDACIVPDLVGLRLDAVIEIAQTTDGISVSWDNYCDDTVLATTPAAGEPIAFQEDIVLALTACDG